MTTAADRAVHHVLGRILNDPRLAFLIGPGSEAWDLLTRAHAEALKTALDETRGALAGLALKYPWCGEMLDWHDAKLSKPDAGLTVVCIDDENVWTGHWDGEDWIGCESGGTVAAPTYWADPKGPRQGVQA